MTNLRYKRTIYYGGLIPSNFFDEYSYKSYLKFASAYELENDIISAETISKMTTEINDNSFRELNNYIGNNYWNKYIKFDEEDND